MKEIRICEIRADVPAGSETLTLTGRPIVYETPTVINDPAGAYSEVIRAGALDETDISDVRLLYNHDASKVPLGRTPKTLSLTKSPAGLDMAAQLPDTEEARAVYTAVERGDLSGMSFAFTIPPGGDKWDLRNKTREIFKIKKILEVSVVPFPAYPQASVEARAAAKAFTDVARGRALIALNKLIMKEIY